MQGSYAPSLTVLADIHRPSVSSPNTQSSAASFFATLFSLIVAGDETASRRRAILWSLSVLMLRYQREFATVAIHLYPPANRPSKTNAVSNTHSFENESKHLSAHSRTNARNMTTQSYHFSNSHQSHIHSSESMLTTGISTNQSS